MSRSLAKSLKKHDIKVLMYSPGSIQTKMGKQDFRQDFNTFLDPQKVAEYIIYATSLSDDMIIDESRINRISIS
jgi:short-subunit dehydrogenase